MEVEPQKQQATRHLSDLIFTRVEISWPSVQALPPARRSRGGPGIHSSA